MRKINLFIALFCILLLALSCSLNTVDDEKIEEDVGTTPENYSQIVKEGIRFQWKVDADNSLLLVKLSAPTTGWVSVGLDPTQMMKDANIIIGYISGEQVFIRDDFGTSNTEHDADTNLGGQDNVTQKAGTEAEGITEIHFAIPLDSEDAKDRPLVLGNMYPIILAYGADGDDSFGNYHALRTVATIEIGDSGNRDGF